MLTIMLIMVFIIDWITGAEVSVGPLYLFAVAYGAWHLGKTTGVIASFIAAMIWVAADWFSGHRFQHHWALWEQAGSRLITFLMLSYFASLYRFTLDAHRRRLASLEQVLAVCPSCGRIGPHEGDWQRAEDLNKEKRDRYQLCPTCTANKNRYGSTNPARNQLA